MGAVRSGVVAVTGASGFLGSHVVAKLLEKGYTVRAVVRDKNSAEKVEHLVKLSEGKPGVLELFSGDLSVPNSYDSAFDGADGIVHAAASVQVQASDPQRAIVDPSVEGTKNVLGSVERAGSSLRRFVHLSSVAAVQNFNQPEDHVFTEEDWNEWSTLENGDAYGVAKTLSEKLVWEASKGKPWDVSVINPTVVFGECYTKAHTKASPVMVRQMLYGNTTLEFNCTYVAARDVAEAHYQALAREEAGGQRYLLVGDEPCASTLSLPAVAQPLFPQYKLDLKTAYPSWLTAAFTALSGIPVLGGYILSPYQRLMSTRFVNLSNEKAKRELGINFMPLTENVRITVESMIDSGFVKPRPRTVPT